MRESVVTVKSRCRTCGSQQVHKTYVHSEDGDRWGFVVRRCNDCEASLGDYDIKKAPHEKEA